MTRAFSFFALWALLPAALGGAVPRTMAMIVPSCGGGTVTLVIPLRPGVPRDDSDQPCCAKGCHTGSSRKKARGCC